MKKYFTKKTVLLILVLAIVTSIATLKIKYPPEYGKEYECPNAERIIYPEQIANEIYGDKLPHRVGARLYDGDCYYRGAMLPITVSYNNLEKSGDEMITLVFWANLMLDIIFFFGIFFIFYLASGIVRHKIVIIKSKT